MRLVKLYRHGFTIGTNSYEAGAKRPNGERGAVSGWSHGSTRRNIAFLRSIDETLLTGRAFAITLTVRDCPPTSDVWHKIRDTFIKRLNRMGLIRLHWVIEWQRRGVPHLHFASYFDNDDPLLPLKIIRSWCDLTSAYGSNPAAQYVLPIYDSVGWYQYVSKHAARGVNHYQRSSKNVPPAWKRKTGRIWGKVGDWPVKEFTEFAMSDPAFYRLRRIVKGWRLADSRAAGCRFRIRSARKYLQKPENISTVMGASEWMPEDSFLSVLYWLKSQNYIFY